MHGFIKSEKTSVHTSLLIFNNGWTVTSWNRGLTNGLTVQVQVLAKSTRLYYKWHDIVEIEICYKEYLLCVSGASLFVFKYTAPISSAVISPDKLKQNRQRLTTILAFCYCYFPFCIYLLLWHWLTKKKFEVKILFKKAIYIWTILSN